MYKNNNDIAIAGNTNPTKGTKIEGKRSALIIQTPSDTDFIIPELQIS
jgi:hypothetical protein